MKILLIIWQLPQIVLGLIVLGVIKLTDKKLKNYGGDGVFYFYTKHQIGVSFGPIIIIPFYPKYKTLYHEKGHSDQSKMLGWLYLPLVGLPSIK